MEAGADDFITKPHEARRYGRAARASHRGVVAYVEAHSEAQFSHGYRPDCYEKYVRPHIEGR